MYSVETTTLFDKQYKKLVKKYPHAADTFEDIFEELEAGNLIGDEYSDLGLPPSEKVIKIKAANIDANRGKKGGFRIIYYAIIDNRLIYLLSVYSKTDIENIAQSEIKEILKTIV